MYFQGNTVNLWATFVSDHQNANQYDLWILAELECEMLPEKNNNPMSKMKSKMTEPRIAYI